ncbi:MAG TPA: hypothetical protein VFE17_08820 [Candidatus Baltobacteraceae bacterium]|nr:hypothetical protein [Candidatus Baltobacteraceae bacterium]
MDAILAALDALAEQRRGTPAPPQAPRPVSAGTPPGRPIPAPARPAAQTSAPPSHIEAPAQENRAPVLQGMFADGNSLLRAIIAAEVLGPPVSLKEHSFWNRQPNEP